MSNSRWLKKKVSFKFYVNKKHLARKKKWILKYYIFSRVTNTYLKQTNKLRKIKYQYQNFSSSICISTISTISCKSSFTIFKFSLSHFTFLNIISGYIRFLNNTWAYDNAIFINSSSYLMFSKKLSFEVQMKKSHHPLLVQNIWHCTW